MMRNVRLFLFLVVIVIIQVTLMPHLRIANVAPDLGLVVAIAVAFNLGPEAGAITGFVVGLGFDLFLSTPLGLNALVYALVGYGVGILQGGLLRSPRILPSLLALIGGLLGGLVLIGIGVLVGVDAVKGTHGVVTISIAALYDALLAPIVFVLVALLIGRSESVKSAWN